LANPGGDLLDQVHERRAAFAVLDGRKGLGEPMGLGALGRPLTGIATAALLHVRPHCLEIDCCVCGSGLLPAERRHPSP